MADHDPQMLKGVLGLLLLSVLAHADDYGYGLVVRLRESGFEDLAEGTVYPGLTRLEQAGLLESYLQRSRSGPARKYYRITAAGLADLEDRRASWERLLRAVTAVTTPTTTPGGTA